MSRRALVRILVGMFVVPLVLAGCGGSQGAEMKPTITLSEANRLADQYIEHARTVLPADAQFEIQEKQEDYPCTDPTDQGSQGRRIAGRTYQVTGIAPDKIPEYFDAMRAWAKQNNYSILDNNPPNSYLFVENKADGFRVSLESNKRGDLYLGSTSPCVWPNGTPDADQ